MASRVEQGESRGQAVVSGAIKIGRGQRLVAFSLGLLVFVLCLVAMGLGDIRLSIAEVFWALMGQGSAADRLVVWEWRSPRVLGAVMLGAALSMSGAIFQRLTRNPLGSPDIVGFNTGSFTGVVLATALGVSGSFWGNGASAIAGGLITAAAVYVLAYKNGLQSFRFIVVGITMSAFLASINTWFMTSFDLATTFEASIWGAGSLLFISWSSLVPAGALICCLLLIAYPATRVLIQLELGDDLARASGVSVERARVLLIALGIALTAAVTAVAGPISFVALAAPQIALRLSPKNRFSVTITALTGSLLLLISDMLAQHAVPGVVLPTGAVTITLGGAYLAWLLVKTVGK